MDQPLISFIIPVYNREKQVVEAVNSIYKSGFDNYEIILINDASSDQSGVACDLLSNSDLRIKSLHNKVNKGPGPSRNEGITLATGRYIYFLDSDDLIDGECLLEIRRILDREYDIDIITMNHMYAISTETKPIRSFTNESKMSRDKLLTEKPAILHTELWRHIFKTRFIREHEITLPDVRLGEDACFSSQAFLQAKVVYVFPKYFCIHRRLPNDSLLESATWQQYVEGFTCSIKLLERYSNRNKLSNAAQNAIDSFVYFCVIPLLKMIPFEELHTRFQILETTMKNEILPYKINMELFSRFGLIGCAAYAWLSISKRIKAEIDQGRNIYLCPAGSVPTAIARNLRSNNIQVTGFLDNNSESNNTYVSDTQRYFGNCIYSFDRLQEYYENKTSFFVVILGTSHTALEIARQLINMGLDEGRQFISALNLINETL